MTNSSFIIEKKTYHGKDTIHVSVFLFRDFEWNVFEKQNLFWQLLILTINNEFLLETH